MTKLQHSQIQQTHRDRLSELTGELVHVDLEMREVREGAEGCRGEGFVVDVAVREVEELEATQPFECLRKV
jgi:hypothetical protein